MGYYLLQFLTLSVSVWTCAGQNWKLKYEEDFSSDSFNAALQSAGDWVVDDYTDPFDTILDDPGLWYLNDYGPAWWDALHSFHTYNKEFSFGTDGWLACSMSARDWDKDGKIENPPTVSTKELNNGQTTVLEMNVPDHTGGVILRPSKALGTEYRIEYTLTTLDFGGKRSDNIEYDGRINGYSTDGCKTQHPWGEGSKTRGWNGDASVPYCEWQDVRSGPFGYNGFHFMTIVDFADPKPRNNHFWHYRRKVLMDSFSQHPDRVGDGTGGTVCNSATNEYYNYRDSNFNTVNMWISDLPNWQVNPGTLTGSGQRFITTCSDGKDQRGVSSAAELLPEMMPGVTYQFAIERNKTGYTLEASGEFARAGFQTLRFFRPFIVDDVPIWHYNVEPGEYDGRFNSDLIQSNFEFGSSEWPDQWPAGSAFPDYFVIGDLYTNVYEGSASLTNIRFYEASTDGEIPDPTPSPTSVPTLLGGEFTVDPMPTPVPSESLIVPPTAAPSVTSRPSASRVETTKLPSEVAKESPTASPLSEPSLLPTPPPTLVPSSTGGDTPTEPPTLTTTDTPPPTSSPVVLETPSPSDLVSGKQQVLPSFVLLLLVTGASTITFSC